MQIVDAVQEIAMQEPDTSWLSEEYASILRDQEDIRLVLLVRFVVDLG
jgi:hypothetical protein